jgi:hypothetical protein
MTDHLCSLLMCLTRPDTCSIWENSAFKHIFDRHGHHTNMRWWTKVWAILGAKHKQHCCLKKLAKACLNLLNAFLIVSVECMSCRINRKD